MFIGSWALGSLGPGGWVLILCPKYESSGRFFFLMVDEKAASNTKVNWKIYAPKWTILRRIESDLKTNQAFFFFFLFFWNDSDFKNFGSCLFLWSVAFLRLRFLFSGLPYTVFLFNYPQYAAFSLNAFVRPSDILKILFSQKVWRAGTWLFSENNAKNRGKKQNFDHAKPDSIVQKWTAF